MHYLGVAVPLLTGLVWILGINAILRPLLRRPRPQSLISALRPSPISLKHFTPILKRRLVGLIFTTMVLGFLGLALVQGVFD